MARQAMPILFDFVVRMRIFLVVILGLGLQLVPRIAQAENRCEGMLERPIKEGEHISNVLDEKTRQRYKDLTKEELTPKVLAFAKNARGEEVNIEHVILTPAPWKNMVRGRAGLSNWIGIAEKDKSIAVIAGTTLCIPLTVQVSLTPDVLISLGTKAAECTTKGKSDAECFAPFRAALNLKPSMALGGTLAGPSSSEPAPEAAPAEPKPSVFQTDPPVALPYDLQDEFLYSSPPFLFCLLLLVGWQIRGVFQARKLALLQLLNQGLQIVNGELQTYAVGLVRNVDDLCAQRTSLLEKIQELVAASEKNARKYNELKERRDLLIKSFVEFRWILGLAQEGEEEALRSKSPAELCAWSSSQLSLFKAEMDRVERSLPDEELSGPVSRRSRVAHMARRITDLWNQKEELAREVAQLAHRAHARVEGTIALAGNGTSGTIPAAAAPPPALLALPPLVDQRVALGVRLFGTLRQFMTVVQPHEVGEVLEKAGVELQLLAQFGEDYVRRIAPPPSLAQPASLFVCGSLFASNGPADAYVPQVSNLYPTVTPPHKRGCIRTRISLH